MASLWSAWQATPSPHPKKTCPDGIASVESFQPIVVEPLTYNITLLDNAYLDRRDLHGLAATRLYLLPPSMCVSKSALRRHADPMFAFLGSYGSPSI